MEMEQHMDTYETTNSDYGLASQTSRRPFSTSISQSGPYRSLAQSRRPQLDRELPRDQRSIALIHNPAHPCGIMSMSNVPTNTRGEFTNVRRDFHSDSQGLWSNCAFNTPGATLERGVGTYSNLQGGWGRMGRSTYDAMHGNGDWANKWQTYSYQPATARSLYDHKNVDPRDNWVPMETVPQNMRY